MWRRLLVLGSVMLGLRMGDLEMENGRHCADGRVQISTTQLRLHHSGPLHHLRVCIRSAALC
jgi:hypothetical protein